MKNSHPSKKLILGLLASSLLLSACAGGTPATSTPDQADSASNAQEAGPFNLDELIEKAQQEGPITVYDSTSKIEEMAEKFSAEYGIEATGVKVDSAEAVEKITREAQANNIVGDVVALSDMPSLKNQLLPEGFVYSWVPADVKDNIPAEFQDPLVMITDPSFWTYNTEAYDRCPVDNIWDLTTDEWQNKVTFQDPVGDNGALDWFSQMAGFGDDELREAYKDAFGEELETDKESAAAEWVSRMAANKPILTKSSEEASEAVGATGQEDPPVGLMSSAKYRNIDEKGYALGVCESMTPWVGNAKPKGIAIASGTESPNAAKLFVHYALSQDGIEPQINDGKISSNSEIVQPEDPADVAKHRENIFYFSNDGLDDDWNNREQWQDLWRTSNR